MLNKQSPLPLYHQLAEMLLADIRAGRYAEGDKIASENELAQRHGIGRPTVRQAVESLVRRGVLVRRRGSGTFVAEQPETVNLFSLTGTLQSLASTGGELEVEMVSPPLRARVDGDDTPFSGGEAIALTRLSRLDGVPVLVEHIHLHPGLFAGIETLDLDGQSLSGVVQDHFKLTPSSADQHFRITYPDADLAAMLELPARTPVLTVSRFLHFPTAKSAIHSTMHCRTDQFIFTQHLRGISHG